MGIYESVCIDNQTLYNWNIQSFVIFIVILQQFIIQDQQLVSLKWKIFDTHISSSLNDLYPKGKFTDVTLVSDDQIQFEAHKFVLSACSPVVKNLLLNNPHSHPLIYLRGVMHQELKSILEFMYLGEVKIPQNYVGQFVKTSKDLQIALVYQTFLAEDVMKDKVDTLN